MTADEMVAELPRPLHEYVMVIPIHNRVTVLHRTFSFDHTFWVENRDERESMYQAANEVFEMIHAIRKLKGLS